MEAVDVTINARGAGSPQQAVDTKSLKGLGKPLKGHETLTPGSSADAGL